MISCPISDDISFKTDIIGIHSLMKYLQELTFDEPLRPYMNIYMIQVYSLKCTERFT